MIINLKKEEWDFSSLQSEELLPALRWETRRECAYVEEAIVNARAWLAGKLSTKKPPMPKDKRTGKRPRYNTNFSEAYIACLRANCIFPEFIPVGESIWLHKRSAKLNRAEHDRWLASYLRPLVDNYDVPWLCLPESERHRLCKIVDTINGEPRVQEIVKKQFGGRAVTEQNLSEWKQTGHPEWLRQEETRSLVSKLTEQSDDLDEAADGMEISDRYASVLAVELIRVTRTRLEKETDPENRWKIICEALPKLSQLQFDGHRAVRTGIKRERWSRQIEREEDEELERLEKERKQHLIDACFSPMHNQTTAEYFGGGEYGKKMAELIHRIKFDLPLDDLLDKEISGKPHTNGIKPNPTESDQIQPNPTNFANGHAPVASPHDDAT